MTFADWPLLSFQLRDPNEDTKNSRRLFSDKNFLSAVFESLDDDGIIAAQIGAASTINSMPDSHRNDGLMMKFLDGLEDVGFASVNEYEEMHGRLATNWRYIVALKDRSNRAEWYGVEPEVALRLRKRIVDSTSGESPLQYFDSSSQMLFQYPSRAAEDGFCRAEPDSCELADFDPFVKEHPVNHFEVRQSIAGPFRGVYAKVDVLKGEYLSISECVTQMFVPPKATEILFKMVPHHSFYHTFAKGYLDGYGLQDSHFVSNAHRVCSSDLLILNSPSFCFLYSF